MNVTNNLKLPQYTEEDIFDLQDINKAYDSIDKAYKEVIDFKNEIPKTNATAEVIDARGGKETLGKRLDEFGSQLDTKVNNSDIETINSQQAKLTNDIETINSRLKDIAINVKQFGAVGDGVTDDTLAIQTAINSTGASKILIPSGTYLVGDLKLKFGQILCGESSSLYSWGNEIGPSILKAKDGANYVIKDARGVHLEHLFINGNSKASNGIYCGLREATEDDIYTDGNISLYDVKLYDCKIALQELRCASSIFKCQFNNNEYGIKKSTDSRIINNTFNKNTNAIWLESNDNIVLSNKIEWNDNYGIFINGSNNIVSLNTIDRNKYGIYLYSATGATIIGNYLRRNLENNIYIRYMDNTNINSNTMRQSYMNSDGNPDENDELRPLIHTKLIDCENSNIKNNSFEGGISIDTSGHNPNQYVDIKDNVGTDFPNSIEIIKKSPWDTVEASATKTYTLPYPTGYTKNNCYVIGYKLGESNEDYYVNNYSQLVTSIKLLDDNISVTFKNTNTTYRLTPFFHLILGIIPFYK